MSDWDLRTTSSHLCRSVACVDLRWGRGGAASAASTLFDPAITDVRRPRAQRCSHELFRQLYEGPESPVARRATHSCQRSDLAPASPLRGARCGCRPGSRARADRQSLSTVRRVGWVPTGMLSSRRRYVSRSERGRAEVELTAPSTQGASSEAFIAQALYEQSPALPTNARAQPPTVVSRERPALPCRPRPPQLTRSCSSRPRLLLRPDRQPDRP